VLFGIIVVILINASAYMMRLGKTAIEQIFISTVQKLQGFVVIFTKKQYICVCLTFYC
jgi:hypothetical protein